MNIRRFLSCLIAYSWAAPNTLLGLAAGLVMLCLGGRLRFVAGVAEFHGGWLGRIVARLPEQVGFGTMTLGHAIVGIDQSTLCVMRAHEHAHVRQYEQGRLFFLPAYALSVCGKSSTAAAPMPATFLKGRRVQPFRPAKQFPPRLPQHWAAWSNGRVAALDV